MTDALTGTQIADRLRNCFSLDRHFNLGLGIGEVQSMLQEEREACLDILKHVAITVPSAQFYGNVDRCAIDVLAEVIGKIEARCRNPVPQPKVPPEFEQAVRLSVADAFERVARKIREGKEPPVY